jgi:hypothetical protein
MICKICGKKIKNENDVAELTFEKWDNDKIVHRQCYREYILLKIGPNEES